METKLYSSSGFSHQCSKEEMYVLTQHWLADLRFFNREISYFQSLIQTFFKSSLSAADLARVEMVEERFNELQLRAEELKLKVELHEKELSAVLNQHHSEEQVYFSILQSKLEAELFDFVKTLRKVKQNLFEATKHIHLQKEQ